MLFPLADGSEVMRYLAVVLLYVEIGNLGTCTSITVVLVCMYRFMWCFL